MGGAIYSPLNHTASNIAASIGVKSACPAALYADVKRQAAADRRGAPRPHADHPPAYHRGGLRRARHFLRTYEVLLAGTLSTTLEKQFALTENSVKAVLASAFVGQFLAPSCRAGGGPFRAAPDVPGQTWPSTRSSLLSRVVAERMAADRRPVPGRRRAGRGTRARPTRTCLTSCRQGARRLISYAYTIGFLGVPAPASWPLARFRCHRPASPGGGGCSLSARPARSSCGSCVCSC